MTATTPETTVETLPYKNPDLPASERIADLLSRMTLEEMYFVKSVFRV